MAYYARSIPGPSHHQPAHAPRSSPSQPARSPASSNTKTMPTSSHWNAPAMHPPATLESFAWPCMWFQLPSPTTGAAQCSNAGAGTNMFPYVTDLECPELDHSKTPEFSPVSLHESCMTPLQDQDAPYVAICDVPLVAPRPLPFTPPTFLQFDHLPEEDEDLSFPPYTRSRRHTQPSLTQGLAQDETQSHTSPSLPTSQNQTASPSESRKRQRTEDGVSVSLSQPVVAPPTAGASTLTNSGGSARSAPSGLLEHAAKRRKVLPTYPNLYTQPEIFFAADNKMWAPHQTYATRAPFFVPQLSAQLNQGMIPTNWV